MKLDGIFTECAEITSTTIYTKICQEGIIDPTYKNKLSLRDTTKCGFQFLQLLLFQAHPQLKLNGIATQDIPKFSETGNLYLYAKSMVVFIKMHELKRRKYSEREGTEIYLSHLDHASYEQAILKYQMALTGLVTPPTGYTLPAIAGTIEQLCPHPLSRDSPRSDRQHAPKIPSLVEMDDMYTSYEHDNDYEEPEFVHAFRDSTN